MFLKHQIVFGNIRDIKRYRDKPRNPITMLLSFEFKTKITGNTPNNGSTKNGEIIVSLKYFSNF